MHHQKANEKLRMRPLNSSVKLYSSYELSNELNELNWHPCTLYEISSMHNSNHCLISTFKAKYLKTYMKNKKLFESLMCSFFSLSDGASNFLWRLNKIFDTVWKTIWPHI